MKQIQIEKSVHLGYSECMEAKEKGIKIGSYFGKWHFIYTKKGKSISLVKLKDIFSREWYYEIFCLEGNLFEDTERFLTKKDADKRIREIFKGV